MSEMMTRRRTIGEQLLDFLRLKPSQATVIEDSQAIPGRTALHVFVFDPKVNIDALRVPEWHHMPVVVERSDYPTPHFRR